MDIPLEELTSQTETALDGGIFRDADIYNVVEADFFDWVLSAEHGRAFIRHLIRRIAAFNWHNVEHDVLKVLYESIDRKSTRLNSSHVSISYAVLCLKKKIEVNLFVRFVI